MSVTDWMFEHPWLTLLIALGALQLVERLLCPSCSVVVYRDDKDDKS